MSRKIQEKRQALLATEAGSCSNPWGGRYAVALVYPNTYHNGMSNLGFQLVYRLLNDREDCLCERFFLPDSDDLDEYRRTGTPLVSLESGRPLSDFDLVSFSVSFENDYLNLPQLFELARLPWLATERDKRHPLLLMGGVCAFMNPEPLAEVMDMFAIGEAEAILPALLSTLVERNTSGRPAMQSLAQLPGIYVPSLYDPEYDDGETLKGWAVAGSAPLPVQRVWAVDLDQQPCRSFIQAEATEFGDMAMTEVSRGCSRGCRFCAAGFLFLPPRERSLGKLLEHIDAGLECRQRQGLVSPAVADHPSFSALQQAVLDKGGSVSLASIRMEGLTVDDVAALKRSGHKTVALAPEAGSQRLRDVINKNVSEEQILAAIKLLADGGIPNLKLYFLVGLPTETHADVEAIVTLTERIRAVWIEAGRRRGWLGSLQLSVNPFVPKPFTPFQWEAMATEKALKKLFKQLRTAINRLPNVSIGFESPRLATLQGLLSRGDRRFSRLIPLLAEGLKLRDACRQVDIDGDRLLHQDYPHDAHFPWDLIASGVAKSYLWRERQAAYAQTKTPRCRAGCHRCGIC